MERNLRHRREYLIAVWIMCMIGYRICHAGNHPVRVISMAPNLTEIVCALDQIDRLAGVSTFDTWPAAVRKLPKIGGYFNPDMETLIRLQPDLVLLVEGRNRIEDKLNDLGIRHEMFRSESLADFYSAVTRIGDILGVPESAAALTVSVETSLRASKLPEGYHPKVMICIGMTPGTLQSLFVAGNGSFHSDILKAIGCRPVFDEMNRAYFPVSKEAIIAAAPDIILDLAPGIDPESIAARQRIDTWKLLSGIPAVDEGKVILLTHDYLSIPGPRIGTVAYIFASEIIRRIPAHVH
ncbi:ABC transporter substrate-binding protein [bacterium]|nr:ABC transporter substrate-binding protein [candidate division CSSED10-310 bacterium]